MIQNCGPRPQGNIYPVPEGEGDPYENVQCDVVNNATYISGYTCPGKCQADPSRGLKLIQLNMQAKNVQVVYFYKNFQHMIRLESTLKWFVISF